MKRILLVLLLAAAAGAGWFARDRRSVPSAPRNSADSRRILFYQSPMHPWIRSETPGKCTICGMDLAPVYEGQAGAPVSDGLTLSPASISVIDVQTSPVLRQPLRRSVHLAGTLDDDDTRHRVLSAYVEGRLDTLFITYDGAEVVKDEPLARIYSPTLLTAVREYLSLSRNPQGETPLVQAAAQRLVQYGLGTNQIARLRTEFAETNLHVELLAPMTGTVVRRAVYEGQNVTQGQDLFELADFSTMWFKGIAYERDLPWLQPGQTVEISLASVPGRVFTNTIAFINPNFEPETRSTLVRVPIPNPWVESGGKRHRLLSHRVYGTAKVQVVFPDVLTVPRSAVLDPGGRPVVFVELASGTYQPRRIIPGRWGDSDVEVLEGVTAGERVVTSGALLLDAQAQLNLAAAGPAAASATSPESHSPTAAPALTAEQKASARGLMESAAALSRALAQDDLNGFNAAAPGVHARVETAVRVLGSEPAWASRMTSLTKNSHLEPAPDLAAARREFNRFMESAVPVGRLLRATDPEFARLKLYRCPMTKTSFPGAPSRAEWIQTSGPMRNPYFGAEMPDCGTEVAP
ncbi:MAG: efflux RND transporter periplasmic adaptor subunit [Verrucomicrobiales bacterium]|nr:efflux RND transporter periplasmic adaptor subunit [Verrucomicrobiales bacterium]